jgi:hypothetical protein
MQCPIVLLVKALFYLDIKLLRERERERERRKLWEGGSERHYRFGEERCIRNIIWQFEGSHAVPDSPSCKGFVHF